ETIRIHLQTLRWPLVPQSSTLKSQIYSAEIHVKTWDQKVDVCRLVTKVMDRIYQSFNHALPQNRKPTDQELTETGSFITNYLNRALTGEPVVKVRLYRYGETGFAVASRPPYCNSPDKNAAAAVKRSEE
ncbi:MAG: hypothetical protein HQL35_13990, partial [Alphaproteobacteria bacterium]|nr:hypothetical protein [Alphaproteobacteria bacterium]